MTGDWTLFLVLGGFTAALAVLVLIAHRRHP